MPRCTNEFRADLLLFLLLLLLFLLLRKWFLECNRRRLLGTLDPEQIDREIRHQLPAAGAEDADDQNFVGIDDVLDFDGEDEDIDGDGNDTRAQDGEEGAAASGARIRRKKARQLQRRQRQQRA